MKKKIVIVGGVAAGPKAACRLKRLMADADVTVIDQDSFISYSGCGIPYYISGDVADEKELRSTTFRMLRDEHFFYRAKGVKVLTSTKVLAIDRTMKTVQIQDISTGIKDNMAYDILLLATGSQPRTLSILGNEADNVFTINDLHKAIAIKDLLTKGKIGKAVVIGGGAIGIEMAESFADLWGVKTTIIEFQDQILPGIVDWPLAAILKAHLCKNKVQVFCGESAVEIILREGEAVAVKTENRTIDADIVVMAVGTRPQSQLAIDAGLQVSESRGIIVDERMQTSDPDIYAAGDCVEIMNLVSGKRFIAPFGSMANKGARVAADNMAGIHSVFRGGVGSFIMKAFEMCIGSAGLSLKAALAEGFAADVSLSSPSDRAHFYPGQSTMCLQMVFDRRSRKVLGFQGVGPLTDGLFARIDAAAVALAAGAGIDDFANIEMAYSPPFSTAIDPINAAAYIADNLCDKRMRQISIEGFYSWMNDLSINTNWQVLDVRNEREAAPFIEKFGVSVWQNLPYAQVREKYSQLSPDKTFIIVCNAGTRSFEIQVFLDHIGMGNSLVLPGGFNFIRRIGADWLPH